MTVSALSRARVSVSIMGMLYTSCRWSLLLAVGCAILGARRARGQGTAQSGKPDTAIALNPIKITAGRADEVHVLAMQRLTLPTTASVTASQAKLSVNLVDPE